MEDYKNLPIKVSITDFKNLRISHALYIDKTEYIWNLIQACGDTFFMARPRRFGKTLLLSALKYLFHGEKELFEGLAIREKNYDWKPYPVIYLDFGACDTFFYNTAEKLNQYLVNELRNIARQFEVELDHTENGATLFKNLIAGLFEQKGQVVILIDEYDKIITDNFYSGHAEEIIQTMKNFYSVIKACNRYERFVFVTGVTKIALTTFYSAFNNPQDISMDANYSTMLGYTQKELEKYFGDRVEEIAELQKITPVDLYRKMKRWYNGYCFCENTLTVYNPVSVGYFFEQNGKFSNYWIGTGTPSILLKATRGQNFNLENALNKRYSESVFKAYDLNRVSILGLLLQTGYLTIKDAVEEANNEEETVWMYALDFPNYEVKSSFREYLLAIWFDMKGDALNSTVLDMSRSIYHEDLDLLEQTWKDIFAHFIFDLRDELERAYQTVFYVFSLIAAPGRTAAEQHTNRGRTDAVIETEKTVYIFEFKVDAPLGEHTALKQVYEKDYGSRYRFDGKNVYAIGINFSKQEANITEYEAVRYGEKPWEQEE